MRRNIPPDTRCDQKRVKDTAKEESSTRHQSSNDLQVTRATRREQIESDEERERCDLKNDVGGDALGREGAAVTVYEVWVV